MSQSSRVNMASSVTQISGQLFWQLIMKIYQIWLFLALGVPPKSLGNFFYGPDRSYSGKDLSFPIFHVFPLLCFHFCQSSGYKYILLQMYSGFYARGVLKAFELLYISGLVST